MSDLKELSKQDIENLLQAWKKKRESPLKKDTDKPVCVIIGEEFTGKSTIMSKFNNITVQNNKELYDRMYNDGKGTKDFVFIPGTHVNFIDSPGKTPNQNARDYAKKLNTYADSIKPLGDDKPFDLLIIVLLATNGRSSDISTFAEVCREILSYNSYKIPYVVLLNKTDLVNDKERNDDFEDRKEFCHREFNFSNMFKKGLNEIQRVFGRENEIPIYELAASPKIDLPRVCLNLKTNASKAEKKFHALMFTKVKEQEIEVCYCEGCRKVFIMGNDMKKFDFDKFKSDEELEGEWELFPIPSDPKGLDVQHDPFPKFVTENVRMLYAVNILQSLTQNYDKRAASAGAVIENISKKVCFDNDGPKYDGLLCEEIARLFDLNITGSLHNPKEKIRWNPLLSQNPTIFQKLFSYFGLTEHKYVDYVASWGIFYVHKYWITVKVLMEGAYNTKDANAIPVPVAGILKAITAALDKTNDFEKVKEIHGYVQKNGRDKAYQHYLQIDALPEWTNNISKIIFNL